MLDTLNLSCCSATISLLAAKVAGYRAIKGPFMLTLRAAYPPWSRAGSLTIPSRLTAHGHHFVAPSDEVELRGSAVGPLVRVVASADAMDTYVKASALRDLMRGAVQYPEYR